MGPFMTFVLGAGGLYIGYKLVAFGKAAWEKRNKLTEQGSEAPTVEAIKDTAKDNITPEERYPKSIQDESPKALGGLPEFYNEVDHSRGRFLGWVRTPEDKADSRKVLHGFFRARVLIDVKYMWLLKASKEELTPCVFRPGIDAIFKGPGEAEGVPTEGIVVFKRSMDGTSIASGAAERYKNLLLDEKHKNGILSDMLINTRDKERILGSGDHTRELSEEMENKLKRSRKVYDAAGGRSGMDKNTPYGQEMYGEEEGGMGGQGSEGMWKFEG